MKLNISFLFLVFIFLVVESKLDEKFHWNQMTFEGLPKTETDQIGNYSYYIPYNNVPTGVTHHKGRVYISIARRTPGIPSTLNFFDINQSENNESPSIQGYPNYDINELHPLLQADANRLVSVYRTRVDCACNRLWFVDTGMLEYRNDFQIIQRPSIWAIDLTTNQVLTRFEIPSSLVDMGYGLSSVTIDVEEGKCDEAFIYIPDLQTYRLIVYSLKENKAWRFLHNFFYLDPLMGDFNIAGIKYAWDDGIFSIALGSKNQDGYKTAYFHPLSSGNEFTVSTQILRNESLSTRGYHENDFKLLGFRGKDSQSGNHVFDEKSGVIFYTQVQKSGISCWRSTSPFSQNNFGTVFTNKTTMIYPNDISIDSDGTIWTMANSIPVFVYSRLDANNYNFRVWSKSVTESIRGTVCERKGNSYKQGNGGYGKLRRSFKLH